MEYLNELLANSSFPIFSAFILGLMTAISPCPMAMNITAIGYISKDIESKKRVFYNGLFYTLGRAVTYFSLALILFLGASKFHFASFFQQNGEKFLGPLLIVIGILMLDVIKLRFPAFNKLTGFVEAKAKKNYLGTFLLGFVFALAFCPYSGVLYFGMLIPMTLSNSEGLLLPVSFAIASGLPVILFAWLLAFTVSGIGTAYKRIKLFEIWFRRFIAALFIIIGVYYIIEIYF